MTPEAFLESLSEINKVLPGAIPYDREYRINIKKELEGKTLAEVYRKTMPHITEDWKGLIESGKILLEGVNVIPETRVKAGQITSRVVEQVTEPPVSTNLKLIEANTNYWIIEKPSPLPMHGAGRFYKNTLINFLEICFRKQTFHLVHRLDANTTGLVIIALNKRTADYFIRSFQEKRIKKEYLALVEAQVPQNSFILNSSIGKETETSGSRSIKPGTSAETVVEVLKTTENLSLLKVTPSTGRTNQIRLHLADAGLPIKGDLGYRNKDYFNSNPMTYPDDSLFLHAHKLTFNHPETGEEITYMSSVPDKFSII